jgi:hypothetical protein
MLFLEESGDLFGALAVHVLNGEPLEILHLPKKNNRCIDWHGVSNVFQPRNQSLLIRDPLLSLSDVAFRHL